MLYTAEEVALSSYVIHFTEGINHDGSPKPRVLVVDDMEAAISANKKLKKCVEGTTFKAGEIEFTTEEKALINKWIGRPWGVEDAEVASELKKKLV